MKISYGRHETDGSSIFTQRILVNEQEYDALTDLIRCEKAMNYPNCEIYLYNYKANKSECDIRFPNLVLQKEIGSFVKNGKLKYAFLKIPHVLFFKKFHGMDRLKTNQNTYIEIE